MSLTVTDNGKDTGVFRAYFRVDYPTEHDPTHFLFTRESDASKSLQGQARALSEEIASDAHGVDPEYVTVTFIDYLRPVS